MNIYLLVIFIEMYSSLDKAREACRQWSLLGLAGQQNEVIKHEDGFDSKSRIGERDAIDGEKRVCEVLWLEKKVLGSYILEKDGKLTNIKFKEFKF